MKSIKALNIIFFFAFGLHATAFSSTTQESISENPKVEVTVFIHGLVGFTSIHTWGHLFDIIYNQVSGTRYEQAVANERTDTKHYFFQAKQNLGLQAITIDRMPGNGAGATADLYSQINALTNATQPQPKRLFFTFGWSGLANRSAHKEAGIELYYALEKLSYLLKAQGLDPLFRIIGYSHGGNVALNLGAACPLHYQEHSFAIDQLILLATPIIHETDYLIQSTLFKKIYNIYSLADACQTIDLLSFKRFGSKRIFTSRPGFKIPKNLHQIHICVTDVTAKNLTDKKNLTTLKELDQSDQASLDFKDCSPGHFDMWKVEQIWTGETRKMSPLNPLPLVAFMPYILQATQLFSTLHPEEDSSIIVDFRPALEKIIVQTKSTFVMGIGWQPRQKSCEISMIGLEKIGEIAQSVRCYQPNEKASKH